VLDGDKVKFLEEGTTQISASSGDHSLLEDSTQLKNYRGESKLNT
jgi:hypothetical protein